MNKQRDYFAIIVIILAFITSFAGVCSIDFTKSYEAFNQYGDKILMYGFGIYKHDSYFKAPILIGSDFATLLFALPIFIYSYVSFRKTSDSLSRLQLISIYAWILYGAASICFGVTYNQLFLLYLLLFFASLFGMFAHLKNLHWDRAVNPTLSLRIFLIFSGFSTLIAWLPDILPSLMTDNHLELIEVYTTEITYVLDMGIISPLCFTCLYLLENKDNLGTVILMILLKICILVGFLMIPQGIMQYLSGVDIPVVALITKSVIFMILGVFAYYFNEKVKREIVYEN